MMTTEILANLATLAPDAEIKTVIVKYNPDQPANAIYTNLLKCSASALKKTAQFLNLGKTVNLTKTHISNWIIGKIKTFLPETCSMCNESYCIEFGSTPLLKCFLCGQGIHDKCYISQTDGRDPLPQIKGLQWMCPHCEPRATLGKLEVCEGRHSDDSQNESRKDKPESGLTNTQDPKEDETGVVNTRVTKEKNRDPTNDNSEQNQPQPIKEYKPICIHYRNNRCRHGITGKDCAFRHPKPCKKYLSFGDKQKNGCNKGRNCENFHPKMCRNAMNKGECLKENCKFMHIKGTKRIKTEHESSTSEKSVMTREEQIGAQQPTTGQNVGASTPSPNESVDSFLGLLQQIQYKLQQIESTQQGQSNLIQCLMTQNQPAANYQMSAPVTAVQPQIATAWRGQM